MASAEKINEANKRNIPFSPPDISELEIKASMEEYGFADPLVVNADGTIIGGHQRLSVAQALGYTEVPCAVVNLDKVQEKALNTISYEISSKHASEIMCGVLKLS